MPEKPLLTNQRESGISRIVGFDEKIEAELLDYFRKQFERDQRDGLEKEHSPELKEIITKVNEKMVDFLERYGVDAVYIPSKNVHILDKSKLDPEKLNKFDEEYKKSRGFYAPLKQGVAIMDDYREGQKLPFTHTMVHEMLHLNGFYSYQTTSKENAEITLTNNRDQSEASLNIRRSGFAIGTMDGNELLFNDVNEAIITELAIRFEREYFYEWPELRKELKARDKCIKEIAEKKGVDVQRVRDTVGSLREDKWQTYSYYDVRVKFNMLIDDLYEKNEGRFPSREAVFSLFAKAAMMGKILPVARLIEGTYGKGKFRELGEKTVSRN